MGRKELRRRAEPRRTPGCHAADAGRHHTVAGVGSGVSGISPWAPPPAVPAIGSATAGIRCGSFPRGAPPQRHSRLSP